MVARRDCKQRAAKDGLITEEMMMIYMIMVVRSQYRSKWGKVLVEPNHGQLSHTFVHTAELLAGTYESIKNIASSGEIHP
jgi:hypothetical protein